MPPRPLTYNATLVAREDFTAELAAFHVRYDEPLAQAPAFRPGQYVALGRNNEARPVLGGVRRSMSIASAPEQTNALEFYIRYVAHPASDNPLTHLLWPMRIGERLFMSRKPVGKFTIEDTLGEPDSRIRLFVAAGTGLAPFLSMLRAMAIKDARADMRRILLIHAASYPADLRYGEELARYAERHGLRCFRSVSRAAEAAAWTGDTGRAEDYFVPERLEALEERAGLPRGALNARDAGVLVCGFQGTIARSIERLAPRGFVPFHRRIRGALGLDESVPASLWWEQYDAEPVIDLRNADAVAVLKDGLRAGIAELR